MQPARDMVVFGFLLLVLIAFLAIIVPAAIAVPNTLQHPALSPRFLPSILGVSIIVLALIGLTRAALALRRLKSARGTVRRRMDTTAEQGSLAGLADEVLPLLAFGLLVAALLLTPLIGMVPAGTASVIALLVLGGERRLWAIALVGIGLSFGMGQVFSAALNVPVPMGALFR